MSLRVLVISVMVLSSWVWASWPLYADVVKPALVEINVDAGGEIDIELRASIEALLTGINARYRNTTEAPTAEQYDVFRKMQPDALHDAFDAFHAPLLQRIELTAIVEDWQGEKRPQPVTLRVEKVEIPLPGYTKVPRISTIHLHGRLPEAAVAIQWYYPAKFGDNAVRVRQVDEANQRWYWSSWEWLKSDQPSSAFSLTEIVARPQLSRVIVSYIVLGFEHIVPKGLDHILFILGIFLLSTTLGRLLWQVTMFTLAHTITLGLSMHGVIALPASVVEPLIALSIAYVGIENVFTRQLYRRRLILVFLFGLLHGLGFASVLRDFGMPENDFATALISFNVGVELGQLAVVSMAFVVVGYWMRDAGRYRKNIAIPASILISMIGLFWTVERVFV